MLITKKDNPAEIENYAHIKPAPVWGPLRCFERYLGKRYSCTLSKGHSGPHVAHGFFNKVSAVWDRDRVGTLGGSPEQEGLMNRVPQDSKEAARWYRAADKHAQWSARLSAAYKEAQLTLSPEKKRSLFKETVSPEQGQLIGKTFEVLMRYFFNRASCGEPCGPLDRIRERFGRSLEENYGLTEGPFMDLAKAYWTFKLEVQDFVVENPNIGLSEVLENLEIAVASVFFPTPGPHTMPLEERVEKQRELLSTLAPKMDIERFFAESPLLKPKHGSGQGKRIVPLTFGVAYWLLAVGLYYFVPNVIALIIGAVLAWLGWSSIKMALFGSQELVDAMTSSGPEPLQDSDLVAEAEKFHNFR